MKIIWSPLALDRVYDIALHISEDKINAAEKWVTSIFERVSTLETFPKSGRVVPELGKESIREVLFGDYRIVYRLLPDEVQILTIRHGQQILSARDLG